MILLFLQDLLKLHSKLLAKLEKACTEGLTIGVVFLDTVSAIIAHTVSILKCVSTYAC